MKKIFLISSFIFGSMSICLGQNNPNTDVSIQSGALICIPSSTPGGDGGPAIFPGGTISISMSFKTSKTWTYTGNDSNDDLELTITLLKVQGSALNLPYVKNNSNVIQDMFTWVYNSTTNVYKGYTKAFTQIGLSGYTIYIDNMPVTAAASPTVANIGSNINITAAPGMSGNSISNDYSERYTFSEDPIVLPVTLTNLTGSLLNNQSNLTWSVWGEYDIANYEVLRSTNAIDFVSVGKVSANNSRIYNMVDNVAGLGNKFYYKLKINENSNEYQYSKVVVLSKSADNKITVYPNPASHVVNISSLIGTETISVLSVDGRKIMEHKASEGNNVVNIEKLANGTYSLVITNGEEVTTFKIVKN